MLQRTEALARLTRERSGHLATVGPDGAPHVVVVTFALTGDHIVTAVDHKPKTTRRLQRLVDVEHNGRASFLVDHYSDDWDALWWVRVDGPASVHDEGDFFRDATVALAGRYAQYAEQPPEGPVIAIGTDRVTGWVSTP